jgi:uncharacterized tellurite resistance protein B-like protein
MNFWDIFTKKDEKKSICSLRQKIIDRFPNDDENRQILLASISGLCARVAYIDFEVCLKETKAISDALIKWMELDVEEAEFVANLAISEVKELAGLDNRNYCTALNDILDNNQKLHLLETLFQISAADGHVEQNESEEIRIISKGLLLEQKHFIAARATVAEYIGALRSN